MNRALANLRLFSATFIFAALFLFGATTLTMLFAPALASVVRSDPPFYPQLPLSGECAEAFLDISTLAARQLYPPLTSIEDTAGESVNQIVIPAIQVQVPLALSPSITDSDVLKTLDRGAALYPNGIAPGHIGNTFISAHSTGEPWKGAYRFAFLRINEVEPGHTMYIDYQGTRYTYRVATKRIVKPTSDYSVRSDRPVPTVTLMACWPLWTTNQRMLITGELINITQLTPLPV